MLQFAFKEWAVVCKALAEGSQALILRKGGIAERGGRFMPEHSRFWLYPTYVHQQAGGIKAGAAPLLQRTEAEQPPIGTIRLQHFAEVSGVFFVRHLEDALALDQLHIWSDATIRQRFNYREPGLYVLPVRVFRITGPIEFPENPAYEGCKTWVDLDRPLSDEGGTPVLDARTYAVVLEEIDRLLSPTAFA